MPDAATHVLILSAGRAHNGLGSFGFTIRGLAGPADVLAGSGVFTLDKTPLTEEYAACTAIGRALALCVASYRGRFSPETVLTICTDSKNLVDHFTDSRHPAPEALVPLIYSVREKVAVLGCDRSLQWIPTAQNAEADFLCRAAHVGRSGKPAPDRSKGGA